MSTLDRLNFESAIERVARMSELQKVQVDEPASRMTGAGIRQVLFDLLIERTNESRRRMESYDREVYDPAVKTLQEQCQHEPGSWNGNGLGWSWLVCKWCGITMEEHE
jgi:hypothetical protein